jgi:hypothetical protein
MDKKIINVAGNKGFISRDNLIELNEDNFYLWICELQQWLRDKKEIEIVIEVYTNADETGKEYEYVNYSDRVESDLDHGDGPFDTYEEAIEAACMSGLNLLEDDLSFFIIKQ